MSINLFLDYKAELFCPRLLSSVLRFALRLDCVALSPVRPINPLGDVGNANRDFGDQIGRLVDHQVTRLLMVSRAVDGEGIREGLVRDDRNLRLEGVPQSLVYPPTARDRVALLAVSGQQPRQLARPPFVSARNRLIVGAGQPMRALPAHARSRQVVAITRRLHVGKSVTQSTRVAVRALPAHVLMRPEGLRVVLA